MRNKRQGPKHLNLLQIRMPVTAWMSIAHRASGVFMFLAIPLLAFLLGHSLAGPEGYADVVEYFDCLLVQIPIALLLWSMLHHLFAGIRFLLIDIDIGVEQQSAKRSALIVILAGIGSTIALMGLML